jgi:hypothetical protein
MQDAGADSSICVIQLHLRAKAPKGMKKDGAMSALVGELSNAKNMAGQWRKTMEEAKKAEKKQEKAGRGAGGIMASIRNIGAKIATASGIRKTPRHYTQFSWHVMCLMNSREPDRFLEAEQQGARHMRTYTLF